MKIKAGDKIKTERGVILNIVEENGILYAQNTSNKQKTKLSNIKIGYEVIPSK